jgi:hypothetical protein
VFILDAENLAESRRTTIRGRANTHAHTHTRTRTRTHPKPSQVPRADGCGHASVDERYACVWGVSLSFSLSLFLSLSLYSSLS